MQEVSVIINSIDKVKSFVEVSSSIEDELELKSGRYVIDAKSIIGIFSLNLCHPLTLVIHNDDKSIISKFKDYLA